MTVISPFKLTFIANLLILEFSFTTSSCHPNFTFSGIVYSQGLRLRRLINNDKRLAEQLDYLKADFLKCMYPVKLLDDIFSKIKDMSRNLEKKDRSDEKESKKI